MNNYKLWKGHSLQIMFYVADNIFRPCWMVWDYLPNPFLGDDGVGILCILCTCTVNMLLLFLMLFFAWLKRHTVIPGNSLNLWLTEAGKQVEGPVCIVTRAVSNSDPCTYTVHWGNGKSKSSSSQHCVPFQVIPAVCWGVQELSPEVKGCLPAS